MEQTNFKSAEDKLSIIAEAIANVKQNLGSQSFYYILWGWLVVLGSVAQFVLVQLSLFNFIGIPWMIISAIGVVVTIRYSTKHSKQSGIATQLDKFMMFFWIVLGLSFFVVVFMSLMLQIEPAIFTLLLAGIGTLVSGLLINFKPLIYGGVALIVCAIISVFIPTTYISLLNAAGIALGYLIPGYQLRNS